MLLNEHNRIDLARNDTLITRASGLSLRDLSSLYGIPWIQGDLTEPEQHHFLKNTAYTPRGTFSAFFNSIRAYFYKHEIVLEDASVLKGSSTTTISHTSITAGYDTRIIEIINGSRKTIHKVLNASTGTMTISRAENTAQGQIDTANGVIIRVLPFELFEILPASTLELEESRPCEVIIELDSAFQNVPPTYLREDGNARTNDPFGGHILDLFDNDLSIPSAGNQINGPYPLYLDGEGDINTQLKNLFQNLLPASIRLTVRTRTFTDTPFGV